MNSVKVLQAFATKIVVKIKQSWSTDYRRMKNSNGMKKLTSILAFLTLLAISVATPSFAHAQSTGVQKALESVKETIDNLVSAKDSKQSDELSLRIQTLKRAIGLSIEEARDARAKLDGLDKDTLGENEVVWRDAKLKEMESALSYFETRKSDVEDNSKDITATEAKNIAENFKTWRDENYLHTLNEVRDYFFVGQQEKTIDTARARWQKIDEDIKKLEKAKVRNIILARKLLKNANTLITDSNAINEKAHTLFFTTFINISTSTATSSASEDIKLDNKMNRDNKDATSTVSDVAAPSPQSIRDLVKDSSLKIRDAYKIFIDMSSLVRRLLK